MTGSSSGFGLTLVQRILSSGEIAVATMRNPSSAPVYTELQAKYAETLLVVKLDVTKEQEINDAFEQAKNKFGRIDVVFNNAGYAIGGLVEGTPLEEGRELFEVSVSPSLFYQCSVF